MLIRHDAFAAVFIKLCTNDIATLITGMAISNIVFTNATPFGIDFLVSSFQSEK